MASAIDELALLCAQVLMTLSSSTKKRSAGAAEFPRIMFLTHMLICIALACTSFCMDERGGIVYKFHPTPHDYHMPDRNRRVCRSLLGTEKEP